MDADELAKLVTKAAHGSGMFETWDALVSTLAAFLASGCGNECQWLTERADGALARLTVQGREDVPKLFDPVFDAFEENPNQDLLGDTYMRLGIGNKSTGQFFTPYHVSEMMARLAFSADGARREIERHGYVTFNEPAVGGGANAIAYANVLGENGIDYQRQALFVVQELSELTALTCYVQMAVLGMAGVVYIGDSLRMDYHHALYTPMCVIEDAWSWRMLARAVPS